MVPGKTCVLNMGKKGNFLLKDWCILLLCFLYFTGEHKCLDCVIKGNTGSVKNADLKNSPFNWTQNCVLLDITLTTFYLSFFLFHLQSLFHKQRNLFQKARAVQNQRLRKIKNLYDQFLKVCWIWWHNTFS